MRRRFLYLCVTRSSVAAIARVRMLAACTLLLLPAAVAPADAIAADASGGLFSEGRHEVTIPLGKAYNGFYVRATVNGLDVGYFLIDTGTAMTAVSEGLAKQLALPRLGRSSFAEIDGVHQREVVRARRIQVGALSRENMAVSVAPRLGYRFLSGDMFCGLLGMDVLGRQPFTLDFANGALTLYDPAHFVPPAGRQAFPLRLWRGTPLVQGTLEGDSAWFAIDTGHSMGLFLSNAFAVMNRHLVDGRPRLNEGGTWDAPAATVGTRWNSFTWLDSPKRPEVHGIYQVTPGMADVAGLIGLSWLRDARLTIDCASRQVWVEWPDPQEPLDALLKRLGDPASRDLALATPLLLACHRRRSDAVRALLEHGADPNAADAGGITPLMSAAGLGDAESTAALLAAGARHDARSNIGGYTPLAFAAEYGRPETAQLLLKAGADVNLPTGNGRPAAFIAADADRPQMLQWLLEHGARADLALPSGDTPLSAASRNGSAECVKILLAHQADPNVAGPRGTPLAYAAGAPSAECVRLLLAAGARVNDADKYGRTPLHSAAHEYDGAASARLLLAAGADPARKAADGKTALDYAIEHGSPETCQLLMTR